MNDKKIAPNSGAKKTHIGIGSASIKPLKIDTSLLKNGNVDAKFNLTEMKTSTKIMKRLLWGLNND